MPAENGSNLHKHCFWVLTTLLGFSLREALAGLFLKGYTRDIGTWTLELFRVGTLTATVIAFLLGAARYFEDQASKDAGAQQSQSEDVSYVLDLALAVLHFAAVFILATLCTTHDQTHQKVSSFGVALAFVLVYDLLWVWLSPSAGQNDLAREWAGINCQIVVVSGFIFFLLRYGFTLDPYSSEEAALLPAILGRVLDVRRTFGHQRTASSARHPGPSCCPRSWLAKSVSLLPDKAESSTSVESAWREFGAPPADSLN